MSLHPKLKYDNMLLSVRMRARMLKTWLKNCKLCFSCRRGTSTGFLLQEESLDDGFYQGSLEHDMNSGGNDSDKYSFTTDSSGKWEEDRNTVEIQYETR